MHIYTHIHTTDKVTVSGLLQVYWIKCIFLLLILKHNTPIVWKYLQDFVCWPYQPNSYSLICAALSWVMSVILGSSDGQGYTTLYVY